MICKLVCYGNTRNEAIDTSLKALDSYVIRGISIIIFVTNLAGQKIPYLSWKPERFIIMFTRIDH